MLPNGRCRSLPASEAPPGGGGRARSPSSADLEIGIRGGRKVGNLLSAFHFSVRPRRRSCGNVGISPAVGEISKGLVGRVGSLLFDFLSTLSTGPAFP